MTSTPDRRSKRGQVFSVDLVLGLLIMTATLLSIVLFLPDSEPPFVHDVERLELLMTQGVPENWTAANVVVPGLLTDDRFNATKVAAFEAMTPGQRASLLGLESTLVIRFYDNGTLLPLCAGCGTVPAKYSQALPVERTAVLDQNITTMEVVLYK